MKFIKLLTMMTLPLFAFSKEFEKAVDISFNANPVNFAQNSHANVNACIFKPCNNFIYLFNPRMCVYLDKKVDFSIGNGVRWLYLNSILGAHVFYDFTCLERKMLHQFGASFEIIQKNIDHKINYYHPLNSPNFEPGFFYETHKWIEYETVHKNDFFAVGIGPTYNFTTNRAGAKLSFTLPMENYFFSVGSYYDIDRNVSGYLSVGMKLFSFGSKEEVSPVCRSNGICFSLQPYFKKKSHKKDKSEKKLTRVAAPAASVSQVRKDDGNAILQINKAAAQSPMCWEELDDIRRFFNGKETPISYINISEIYYENGSTLSTPSLASGQNSNAPENK